MSFEKRFKNAGWTLLWLLPVVLVAVIYLVYGLVQQKLTANSVGKPVIVTASAYGRIDNIFVKPGDIVEPGKEICNFIATDNKGATNLKKEEEPFTDVTIREIKGEKFSDFVELPGIIKPYTETQVPTRVGGQILEIPVREGMTIKKGELVARIDKRDYQIDLNNAEANYNLAKKEYERSQNLFQSKVATSASNDQAEAAYKNSLAALDRARLMLERCEIKSPIDGLIDQKLVEIGENVKDDQVIVKVIDISSVKVMIGIPESDISYVRNVSKIDFTVPSLSDREFFGTVSNIILSSNELAKVFPIIIDVKNDDGRLLPGMVVRAKVIRKTYDNAVMLPIFLILPGDDEYYTYVEKDGRAVKKVIELGAFQTKTAHVVRGLEAGDRL
ncbi:MAG TPA: efflux RND transporter periplasmic adaptor subunit, partial [Candidatus Wallbacteria bacterium]|nr:efflux RND transporter periplasmic adaptor subunit [Candidatus Wallbacteria bacterium]